jgi:alpha-beta hydrolase superfamily lysophospholipase
LTLTAPDRTKLHLRHWPAANPKAVLVICHGLGEHGGRYGNLIERIVPAGYAAYAHDHRGHGKSDGKRGHVMRFDEFTEDALQVVEQAQAAYPGKKLFMFGHSLGGLITLAFALRFGDGRLAGVIASSAALKLRLEVPKVKAALGNMMSSLWPTLTLGNELDPHGLSHDEAVVQAYVNDPLVHDRVSTRFYVEFTDAMRRTLFGAGALRLPLLVFHGGDDPLTHPEGSREFHDHAGSTDKTFRLFEGQLHEVLNDTAKAAALDLVQHWLDQRAAN